MSNNELAHADDTRTNLEVMPPARPVMATARQVLMEHAELADMAYQFATKLVGTKMVPVRYRNQPEEATAAILYGAELGIGPISALQNIFEVHGSPAIYARTAQALLEAKGFQFKTAETTNFAAVVQGWKPGRDPDTQDPDEASKFTIEDAEQAGWCPRFHDGERGGKLINGSRYQVNENGKLIGNEKYLTQPRQMLWAKAMMEVCRHLSPATLLGIAYSAEELESEGGSDSPAPASAASTARDDTLTVEEILAAAPEQVAAQVFPDTTPDDLADPAPAKPTRGGKRDAKREQAKTKGTQIPGKPKGHTDRVEAALAAAHAANPASSPVVEDTSGVIQTPAGEAQPAEPAPEPDGRVPDGVDDGTTPDPSEPDPDGYWPDGDLGDDPDGDLAEQADITDPDPEPVVVDPEMAKPATRDQLQYLTQSIAAAGFQPTPQGREEWFAFVSDTVGRVITANNQMTRGEVHQIVAELVKVDK